MITKGTDGVSTKLFPDRVETVILQHPHVAVCYVVGVPDEMRINYPKVFVVLKDEGQRLDLITISEEIMQICREELSVYMLPDEIEYLEELPRTTRGKTDYRALEKMTKGN